MEQGDDVPSWLSTRSESSSLKTGNIISHSNADDNRHLSSGHSIMLVAPGATEERRRALVNIRVNAGDFASSVATAAVDAKDFVHMRIESGRGCDVI